MKLTTKIMFAARTDEDFFRKAGSKYYSRELDQGHVQVNPQVAMEPKGFLAVYRVDAHRLFFIFLSQKVRQGKTAQALTLLEKSNPCPHL